MNVLVVGMARSGVAAAELAVRKGHRVRCTDLRPDAPRVDGTEAVYGEHRREDFHDADLVVVSPGVPAREPHVAAVAHKAVGELGFAASFLDGLILAVSGTNGKSTTTHLLGQLLARAGLRTFTGGNLGHPLSNAVDGGYQAYAVEVSSYQMELPGTFHPRAGVILNLTADHLERHGSMDAYAEAKCRMFARMGPDDTQILPFGEPRLARIAGVLPGKRLWLGAFPGVRAGDALTFEDTLDDGPVPLDGFPLAGAHNRTNLAAACLLAVQGGVRRDALDVRGLTGLPHRLEIVREHGGVVWIDDSKATNVEAAQIAWAALDRPFVALLGGRGKAGASYEALVSRRARAVVCFGEAGPTIAQVVGGTLVPRLADAVEAAGRLARPGDAVLLSPACASFDEFTDFEHRGRVFRQLVEQLP